MPWSMGRIFQRSAAAAFGAGEPHQPSTCSQQKAPHPLGSEESERVLAAGSPGLI